MEIRKIHRIFIILNVVILFSTCFTNCLIVLAADTNETGTTNESNNGPGMHAQGNTPNRGIMQGFTIWVIIILIIIIIVIVSYILIIRNMKRHMEENTKIMQEMLSSQQISNFKGNINQQNKTDTSIEKKFQKTLLKFLSYNENRVMKNLLEQNGTVNQLEISRLPNMGKVKASRVLRDMKNKGIIEIETHGKINKIHLSDDIKSIFFIDRK